MKTIETALGALAAGAICLSCSSFADAPGEPAAARAAIYGGTEVVACAWESVVEVGGRCSGVLLHPLLVAYAAHCGESVLAIRPTAGGEVATRFCRAYPGASLGELDVAFCVLEEPVLTGLTPPATGCELEALAPGTPAVLVGYGSSEEFGQFGVRRVATATVEAVSETRISVAHAGVGTCGGDSGGPLYFDVEAEDGSIARRVAGVASAVVEGQCSERTALFAPLSPVLGWMEQESGLDLTPCGDARGGWAPTPLCTAGELEPEAACKEHQKPALSGTCGAAFDPAPLDQEPPTVRFVSGAALRVPAEPDSGPVPVLLEAHDRGWGLAGVELAWTGPRGETWNALRSAEPFLFEVPAAGPGRHVFRAVAIDHAGNRESTEQITHAQAPDTGGCTVARFGGGGDTAWVAGLAMARIVLSRRRRTRS